MAGSRAGRSGKVALVLLWCAALMWAPPVAAQDVAAAAEDDDGAAVLPEGPQCAFAHEEGPLRVEVSLTCGAADEALSTEESTAPPHPRWTAVGRAWKVSAPSTSAFEHVRVCAPHPDEGQDGSLSLLRFPAGGGEPDAADVQPGPGGRLCGDVAGLGVFSLARRAGPSDPMPTTGDEGSEDGAPPRPEDEPGQAGAGPSAAAPQGERGAPQGERVLPTRIDAGSGGTAAARPATAALALAPAIVALLLAIAARPAAHALSARAQVHDRRHRRCAPPRR